MGISVWAVTAYKWPAEIRDTTLERTPEVQQEARKLAQRIKRNMTAFGSSIKKTWR